MTALSLTNIALRADSHATQAAPHAFVNGHAHAQLQLAQAIKRAATASDSDSIQVVEEDFLSSIDIDDIMPCLADKDLMRILGDVVFRKFSATMTLEESNNPRIVRVVRALTARQSSLGLCDSDDGERFETAYTEFVTRKRAGLVIGGVEQTTPHQGRSASSPAMGSASGSEPQGYDAASVRRTVQNQFYAANTDSDSAKFTGDIAKPPAFDLWEARYRALMSGFKGISQSDQVLLLSEALDGDALRFFFTTVRPDASRMGMSLEDRSLGVPSESPAPATSLSQAMNLIEKEFLNRDARNVLRQELMQTTLSQLQDGDDTVAALHALRARIDRLSANGPLEYRSESTKIDVLKNCLRGETWAVDTLVACSRDGSLRKVQDYISALISYLRTRDSLNARSGPARVLDNSAVGSSPRVFFGDYRTSGREDARGLQSGRAHRAGAGTRNSARNRGNYKGPRPFNADPEALQRMLKDMKCWLCGKKGHYAINCKERRRSFSEASKAYLNDSGSAEELAFLLSVQLDTAHDAWLADNGEEAESSGDDGEDDLEVDTEESFQTMFNSFADVPDF